MITIEELIETYRELLEDAKNDNMINEVLSELKKVSFKIDENVEVIIIQEVEEILRKCIIFKER